jgi:hypothetical protein
MRSWDMETVSRSALEFNGCACKLNCHFGYNADIYQWQYEILNSFNDQT